MISQEKHVIFLLNQHFLYSLCSVQTVRSSLEFTVKKKKDLWDL